MKNMGLTKSSTGGILLNTNIIELKNKCNYVVGIAGNPNVRKK